LTPSVRAAPFCQPVMAVPTVLIEGEGTDGLHPGATQYVSGPSDRNDVSATGCVVASSATWYVALIFGHMAVPGPHMAACGLGGEHIVYIIDVWARVAPAPVTWFQGGGFFTEVADGANHAGGT
jgi:hypothetical protein